MTHMAPFFAALQDIIRGSEPEPRKFSCNACLDSGEMSEGGPCNWCSAGGYQADELDEPGDDMSVEQACKNMGIKP